MGTQPLFSKEMEQTNHNIESRMRAVSPFFFAVVVIGLALRLFMLTSNELWLDETHSIFIAGDSPTEMVEKLKDDGHPPLYFILMFMWKSLFGESELSVRLLSVLFGMASLAVVYWLGKNVINERVGLVGMFIAAIAPIHVYYSQEARMYIMLAFLSALSSGFLWLAIKHEKKRYWWAYVLSATCLVYTHIFGWFALPAGNIFLLLKKERRRLFFKLAAHQAVIVLLFLPWAPIVPKQAGQAGLWMNEYWQATPPALAILKTLECFGAGANYPPYLRFFHVSPLRFVSYMVFALLGAIAVSRYRDRSLTSAPSEMRSPKLYLLLNLFIPLALPYGFSFVKPIYLVGRNDLMAYPFFALLIGLGLMKLARLAWIGLPAISLLATYSLYKYYSIPTPAFDREAIRYIAESGSEDDLVVVTGLRLCPVEYYMRRENARFRVMPYPGSMRSHPGWVDYRLTPRELMSDADDVIKSAADESRPGGSRPSGSVWLLTSPLGSMNDPLFDEFERHLEFVNSNDKLGVLRFRPIVPGSGLHNSHINLRQHAKLAIPAKEKLR
jgi:hypothetical protein